LPCDEQESSSEDDEITDKVCLKLFSFYIGSNVSNAIDLCKTAFL
jgi:hypothetical protein